MQQHLMLLCGTNIQQMSYPEDLTKSSLYTLETLAVLSLPLLNLHPCCFKSTLTCTYTHQDTFTVPFTDPYMHEGVFSQKEERLNGCCVYFLPWSQPIAHSGHVMFLTDNTRCNVILQDHKMPWTLRGDWIKPRHKQNTLAKTKT